ncbi:hypothetical protein CTEN210_16875 [Chaetoceros tenuissimus]|uniref:ShK domain-containing protein n=1 Tax=Chaetoceros tenuissimus TaxID=426638 RepID=A0AAD3D9Q1_9STRA|nr:hypothetical protein CTEN210_16875 [Chaetoceros tenuissimus]
MKLASTLLLLSFLTSTAEAQCVDSSEKFYLAKKNKTRRWCKWARKKNTSKRCAKNAEVASNCPAACDYDCLRPPLSPVGCIDSPYMYQLLNDKWVDCAWVTFNSSKRCKRYPSKLYCPVTCNTCGSEPSASPTISSKPSLQESSNPSKVPSSAPSGLPSLSPSSAPSSLPSSVPSSVPSNLLSLLPSALPSDLPSDIPSEVPSNLPSISPSLLPSSSPSDAPSRIPSDSPSQVPTACVNSPWSVQASTPSGTLTVDCDSLLVGLCTDPTVGGLLSNDKTASEACCICGGTQEKTITPSSAPSLIPSEEPSACVDYVGTGGAWTVTQSSVVYTCDSFSPGSACGLVYTAGTDGYTASQACCDCGGGTHVINALAP